MSNDENVMDQADESGKVGDKEEPIEQTREQRMALRRRMENIHQSMLPKSQLSNFTVPEATLKNVWGNWGIAERHEDMVNRAMKPILDAQSGWQKRFAIINSDTLKGHALTQSTLNMLASKLIENIDFGLTESLASTAAKFGEQQRTWLISFTPAFAAMHAAFYPPNLRGIDRLRFQEVEQVVMVDGIPLYGVPRAPTAEMLIRADGASKRRDILGRRWKSISADCRTAVEECASGAVAPFISVAVAALDALDAGHTEAAQALAGSLVDAILHSYFGKGRTNYTPDRKGKRTKDAYDEFTTHQFIAFAPMWQAYQKFFVTEGDKVPTTFSRNATAHTVSKRQFNRRNALQGLMVACSLLYRLDEEAAVLERAAET